MWWGVPNWGDGASEVPEGAEDYRNEGLGDEKRWGSGWREGLGLTPPHLGNNVWPSVDELSDVERVITTSHEDLRKRHESPTDPDFPNQINTTADLNDRGRGRTVETQGGGVAVLRAMWEFVHMYSDLTS
jgi:hypothetical protein